MARARLDSMKATYITPKTPRQAILNALCEIEAEGIGERDEQCNIILRHILDYAGGRIFLLMLKRITQQELIRVCFECSSEVKSEIMEKINGAFGGKAA